MQIESWLFIVRTVPSFSLVCDLQVITHHQSHGNVLGLHLVQHLPSPHLEAAPVTLLRPLGQQNLGKLFLLHRAMLLSTGTIQLQGLCPHVLGSSKDTEIPMGVINNLCSVSAITCSLWLEMINFQSKCRLWCQYL